MGEFKNDFHHLELSVVELRGSGNVCNSLPVTSCSNILTSLTLSFIFVKWMRRTILTQWVLSSLVPRIQRCLEFMSMLSRALIILYYSMECSFSWVGHLTISNRQHAYLPFLWLFFSCRIFLFWHAYFILPDNLTPIHMSGTQLKSHLLHKFLPLWTIPIHEVWLNLPSYSLVAL